MLHVVTTGAYYPPVVTTWKILTTGASQLTAVSLCNVVKIIRVAENTKMVKVIMVEDNTKVVEVGIEGRHGVGGDHGSGGQMVQGRHQVGGSGVRYPGFLIE